MNLPHRDAGGANIEMRDSQGRQPCVIYAANDGPTQETQRRDQLSGTLSIRQSV